MANLNKVILIGRLTKDPEVRTFGNGGKVAKFGFAVTNRRRNTQTNQWEDEPMFIDCEAYNRGEYGTLANQIEERCRKGSQICIEARLHLDQWDDKNGGGKRSKHKLVIESLQLLDRREDGSPMGGAGGSSSSSGGGGGGRTYSRGPESSATSGRSGSNFSDDPDDAPSDDNIPF